MVFQTFAAGTTEPVAPWRNCRTVILATSEAGMPSAGLRSMACSVSATQPGETALTRTEMDGSAAAARTKASTAALTVVMIALPGEGYCDARPVVSVIAPPDLTFFTP